MMGQIRSSQDIQGRWGHKSLTIAQSMFAERRAQIAQYQKNEGFGSLYQSILMYKIVDTYTSRSEWVACTGDMEI